MEQVFNQPKLDEILRGVSRSFYLSLKVLPRSIRNQIALAYLLARAADTLADTEALLASDRLDALIRFQANVKQAQCDATIWQQQISECLREIQNTEEIRLLHITPQLFEMLKAYNKQDIKLIQDVVLTLSDGMCYDLNTFAQASDKQITCLANDEALNFYTYSVAGCVGQFWTEMNCLHIENLRQIDKIKHCELGIAYGKGLQLINILRDLPRDLLIGRCYIPQTWLDEAQLSLDLLNHAHNSQLAYPLLNQGVKLALTYLSQARDYVLMIPRNEMRARLAALWPLLIGLETLALLLKNVDRWLDQQRIIKISRQSVQKILLQSLFYNLSNKQLNNWLDQKILALTHLIK